MYDPEMTFRINHEAGTLEAATFRQDGGFQIYQEVYPEPGKYIPKLCNSLNGFALQWFKNIREQNYVKEHAIAVRDGEDVRLDFDADGVLKEPAPEITEQASEPEAAPSVSPETSTEAPSHPSDPVTLYRDALANLDKATQKSNLINYLRDPETDYATAKDMLDTEILYYMDEIAEQNPALYEVYNTFPKFREWLVEDVLERNYQDVILDMRDAIERYADTSEAQEWAKVTLPEPVADNPTPENEDADMGTPEEEPGVPEEPVPDVTKVENNVPAQQDVPAEPDLTPNV